MLVLICVTISQQTLFITLITVHKDSPFKIIGGPKGNRTPADGVTSRYTHRYTMGPILAPVEGIEPPLADLETAALPLHHTGITFGASGWI